MPRQLVAISTSLLLLLVLLAGCVERKPERLARRESPVTSDLRDMARAQAEMRENPQVDAETYRQTLIVFRNRVYDLVARALVTEPEDLARAAEILLQSDIAGGEADCLLAFYMAKAAAEDGFDGADYLAARCIDRHLVTSGQLQRFGTQVLTDSTGRPSIAPYDPNTSDSERADWGVPPLEVLKRGGEE